MKTKPTLLGLLMALSLASPLGAEDAAPAGLPPCCRKELEPGKPMTDASIYQLESKWTSDVGREIQLRVLRGKPQVLVMFYASCQWACPLLVHDLKQIETALPEKLRDEVRFVLVSFDSKRDTVERLHAYRKMHELSTKNWTLLRGNPDDVRELAAVLGVNYREDLLGQFAHSNVITILNRDGEIAQQNQGLNQGPEAALEALAKLETK